MRCGIQENQTEFTYTFSLYMLANNTNEQAPYARSFGKSEVTARSFVRSRMNRTAGLQHNSGPLLPDLALELKSTIAHTSSVPLLRCAVTQTRLENPIANASAMKVKFQITDTSSDAEELPPSTFVVVVRFPRWFAHPEGLLSQVSRP